MAKDPQMEAKSAEMAAGLEGLRETIRKLTRKPRILVVDDSYPDFDCLVEHLNELGECEIIPAHSGTTAVAILASEDVDVIFLDLGLPAMSGLDVMRQMSDEERKKLVIVTGHSEEAEEIKEAIRLGAVKVITKPVKREDLKAIFSRPV